MISYGYSVKEHDDPFLSVAEAAVSGFSETTKPGAYLVDLIPVRKSRFLRRRIPGDANHIFLSPYEQCDTCPTGFLERGGKREPSGSRT